MHLKVHGASLWDVRTLESWHSWILGPDSQYENIYEVYFADRQVNNQQLLFKIFPFSPLGLHEQGM